MARTDPQVNIRMPELLVERLRAAAQANGQTLAAEIISRLESSFPKRFDLLILEARQRELSALSDQRLQIEWALKEYVDQMTDEQRRQVHKEIERMKDQEHAIWREIDRLYSALSDKEGVDPPIGPPAPAAS